MIFMLFVIVSQKFVSIDFLLLKSWLAMMQGCSRLEESYSPKLDFY